MCIVSHVGHMKHKLFYNIDESAFERVAYNGGIAVLERGLNKPSQTKKFTRSNGQSLLNFVNECPRYNQQHLGLQPLSTSNYHIKHLYALQLPFIMFSRSYTLAFIVRRNCVFGEVLNDYLNHIAQGGLIVKWMRDTEFLFDLEYNFHHDRVVEVEDVVLSLEHLEVSFWLLGLGIIVALIAFLAEIVAGTSTHRSKGSKLPTQLHSIQNNNCF